MHAHVPLAHLSCGAFNLLSLACKGTSANVFLTLYGEAAGKKFESPPIPLENSTTNFERGKVRWAGLGHKPGARTSFRPNILFRRRGAKSARPGPSLPSVRNAPHLRAQRAYDRSTCSRSTRQWASLSASRSATTTAEQLPHGTSRSGVPLLWLSRTGRGGGGLNIPSSASGSRTLQR